MRLSGITPFECLQILVGLVYNDKSVLLRFAEEAILSVASFIIWECCQPPETVLSS